MTSLRFADVAEGVRATLARYTLALDDGDTNGVINTFDPAGSFELAGSITVGHDQLRVMYDRWVPRSPQRHMVVNTLVTDWSDTTASSRSDVILVTAPRAKPDADPLTPLAWSIGFVARYHDALIYDSASQLWTFVSRKVMQ